jgi:hypothetical protein
MFPEGFKRNDSGVLRGVVGDPNERIAEVTLTVTLDLPTVTLGAGDEYRRQRGNACSAECLNDALAFAVWTHALAQTRAVAKTHIAFLSLLVVA